MATGKTLELSIKIAGKMDKSLTAVINGTQSKLGSLTKGLSTVGTIGLAAMGAITTAAVGTVAASTKSAAALEQSMSSVKTLLVGTEQAVNARTDQLTNDVMRISVETGVATTDLADGLYQVISAFQDTADSAAILEIATKAAKAGNAEMVDTVNALAAVTKAYGDTSAEQVQYIANLSFETIRLGQTTMPELANGIQKVSGAAAALNVSQAELYAGFASLTGVMGNTDNVGTALNTLYMKMLKPSTAITEAVQSFGYSSAYAMVQAEGIGETIKKLGDYAGSADAFAAMFSMRDLKAAQQILNNYDVYTDKLHQLEAVTADSEQANNAFKTQIDNCNSSIGIIANSFSVLGQSFGQRFLPYLKDFAIMTVPAVQGWVNKLMDGFNVLEPYIANVAGAIMPSIESAFSKVGTVIDNALPKVTQFLDYISKHGEQTVKVIGGLAGTFAAMKFAPLAGNILEGAGSLLFGENGGLGAAAGGSKRSGGLLGAVGSLFTGGQKFAGNAVGTISNVAEAAGVGATMANSNMTRVAGEAITTSGRGGLMQRLENGAIGAIFGIKNRGTLTNQKGTDYKFMQGLMGVAGQITDAKQGGGLLGMAKNAVTSSPIGQYFGGIRAAAGNVANTTIGSKIVGFGKGTIGVSKEILAGIAGPEGLGLTNLVSGAKGLAQNGAGWVAGKAGNVISTVANSGVGQAIGGAAGKVGGVAKGVVSVGSNALGALGNFAGAGAGLLGSVWGPVAGGFGSLFAGAAPVIAAISGIIAVVSILGDHLEDIRGIVVNVFGETGGQVFDVFTGKLQGVADFVTGLFSEGGVAAALAPLQNTITNLFGENAGAAFGGVVTILQSIMGVVGQIVTFATGTVKPIIQDVFTFITGTVLPIILQTFTAAAPTIASIITNLGSAVMTGMQIIGSAIQAAMPIIQGIITVIMTIGSVVVPALLAGFEAFSAGISAVMSAIQGIFQGLITFITGVFSGSWSQAWEGIKQIFGSAFDGLVALCKTPLNAVIAIINKTISGINGLGLTIPEWVPILGGKSFSINIPALPMLAKGGFTDGVSIAGEAGTEAVISFQRGVRSDNINTWTQAGRMLGVSGEQAAVAAGVPYADGGGAVELATLDATQGNNAVELQEIDTGKPQPEQGGGGTPDGGGQVVFAPQIVVQGNADRAVLESVLNDAQQRFEMWYEQMMRRKARTAY